MRLPSIDLAQEWLNITRLRRSVQMNTYILVIPILAIMSIMSMAGMFYRGYLGAAINNRQQR